MENIHTLNSQTDSEMPISEITLKNSQQIKLEMEFTILQDQYKRAQKTILELEKKEAISVKLLQIITSNINKFPNKYKKIFKNQIDLELKSYTKNKKIENMSDLNPEIKNLAIELENFENKIILKKNDFRKKKIQEIQRSNSVKKLDKKDCKLISLKNQNNFLKKKLKQSEQKIQKKKKEKNFENILKDIPTLENSKIVSINSEKDIFSKVENNKKIKLFNKNEKEIKQNLLCDYRLRLESSEILNNNLNDSDFDLKLVKKDKNNNFNKNLNYSKNFIDSLSNNLENKNISLFNEEDYSKNLSNNNFDNLKKKDFSKNNNDEKNVSNLTKNYDIGILNDFSINNKDEKNISDLTKNYDSKLLIDFSENPSINLVDNKKLQKNFLKEEDDSDISKFDLKSINDTSSIIKQPDLRINLMKKFEKVTNSKIENNLQKLNKNGNISFVKKNLKKEIFMENKKNDFNEENFKTKEINKNKQEKKTVNKIRKSSNMINNKKIKKKIFNLEEKISKIKNQLSIKTQIINRKKIFEEKRTSSVENSGIQKMFKKNSPFNIKNILKKNYSKNSLLNKTKKRKKSLIENNFFLNKKNSERNFFTNNNIQKKFEIDLKSKKNNIRNLPKKDKELNKSKSFRLKNNPKKEFFNKMYKTSNFNTLNSSDQNSNPNKKKLIYKNLNVEYELKERKFRKNKKNSNEDFLDSDSSKEQFGLFSNRSKDSRFSINEKSKKFKKKLNFKMF